MAATPPPPPNRRPPVVLKDSEGYCVDSVLVPRHYQPYVDRILIPHGYVLDRVEKLAHDIRADYGEEPIHLLCVLKGGSSFFHDLIRFLKLHHTYSGATTIPFTFDFVRVKSYQGTESTGNVQISGVDLSTLAGKHVLLVEDIIDTGNTMMKLMPMMEQYNLASCKVASLLEKRTERSCGFLADYVGFQIPDAFVIGYCLDYNERFRDMNHVGVINAAGIEHFKNAT